MRIDNPCRRTLQEILDHGSLQSRSAVRHLRSCRHCREQLAGFAHAWSQTNGDSGKISDERFIARVFNKIEHRAKRRRALRLTFYAFASLIAAAVGLYYSGAEIYQSALIPLWQFVANAAAQFPSIGRSLYASLGTVFSGPVMIAVAAGVTVVWVGMLDRVAGLIRLHRA